MKKPVNSFYVDGTNIDSDEDVQEMIDNWDIVTCRYCKKEISMLDAVLITLEDGSDAFVCKSH